MTRYNKQEDFEVGLEVLSPFLESMGYSRLIAEPYRDKEGIFFSATFTLLPRSIEIHHLYSLGPVIYSIGDLSIEHSQYLEALGVSSSAHLPTYEDDSSSGYPALLHDLRTVLSPFFSSSQEAFSQIALPIMDRQTEKLVREEKQLAYGGALEARLKLHARQLFFQKQYESVVEIEAKIRFPEFLTAPEKYIFSHARKRIEK